MSGDPARLQRLLGGPETAWIVDRVRARLDRGRSLTGTVTLVDATEAQRSAVGRLLGRPVLSGRSASIPLHRLDHLLRTSGAWPDGLASAVVALAGPVGDPLAREAEARAWREAHDELARIADGLPDLAGWLDEARARGRLRRSAAGASQALELARGLRAVVRELPADGESLAGFSARVLRDAHALDAGTPLGALSVSAVAAIGGPAAARPNSAAWRREVWASLGILVDDLSSTVLALGLPGGTSSPTAGALTALATSGQPAVLTLRQLVSDGIGAAPAQVSVCENPAVVSAAADRLGRACSPLVCLQGQPGAAAVTLLGLLRDGGTSLRYHGDFDWGGVTIARTLTTHVDWHPWRYGAEDYQDAVRRFGEGSLVKPDDVTGNGRSDLLPKLAGSPLDTPWDPALSVALAECGVRVEEELLLDDLVADLG